MFIRLNRTLVHHLLFGILILLSPPCIAFSTDIVISGSVLGANGDPVEDAVISIEGTDGKLSSSSDALGQFRFLLNENTTFPLKLRVEAMGFENYNDTLEKPDVTLDLRLIRTPVFHETVEVTGSRATEGLTPVPASTISGEEIEEKNWGQDVPLLLQGTPGFYAYNDNGNGVGYSYFFLRGFDMRRTSVQLNGVPLNDANSHAVYFVDLNSFLSTTEEIQVQRGVGRSLYGASAIGGSLNLQTRPPLNEQRIRINTMAGAWDTRRFNIEFDSGLIDGKWATTFRYSKTSSDGYRNQSWLDAWNYFATVEHYASKATTRFILFGGKEKTHLAYEGVTQACLNGEISGDRRRDRRINPLSYPGEIDSFNQPHYQLIDTRELNPELVLQNTVYYFEGEGYYKQYKKDRWMPEYGLEPFPAPDGSLIDTTDLIRKRSVDEWDAGWIPSIEWSHHEGRGKLQAGVAMRLHNSRHLGRTVWAQHYPPDLPPDHPYYDYELGKQSIQPFLEETWRLAEGIDLLGGLTWTSHRYHMHHDKEHGMDFTRNYQYFLPRLGLNWVAGKNLSFYASLSRGAREPAFRDIYDPQDYWFGDSPLDLEEEKLRDYEFGIALKMKKWRMDLNLFYLDFDNEIVWAGGIDEDGLPVTANGARTTHRGGELEFQYFPAHRFGAHLSLSYNHAVFDEFVEYDWDGNPIDYKGNRIAGAPEWMGSLELSAGFGPADFLLGLHCVGKFYLDNTEDNRKNPAIRDAPDTIHRINEAYTTLDLAAKIDLGIHAAKLLGAERISADLRINNVADSLYTTFGYVWGPEPTWIPAATRSFYAGLTLDW